MDRAGRSPGRAIDAPVGAQPGRRLTPREAAAEIWRAGLAAVEPEAAVRRHLRAIAPGVLAVGRHEVGFRGRVWLVGAGKGAPGMARGVASVVALAGGAIAVPELGESPVSQHVGSHPVPTPASDDAGRALADLVASVPIADLICAVWSGGGSATMAGGDVAEITTALLRSGASIEEVNTVRRRVYPLAGGRLRALARAPIVNLGLSDVAPGPLEQATLASGPTVADPTSRTDAVAVLDRLGLARFAPMLLPDVSVGRGVYAMVGGAGDVVHAASHAARGLGYVPLPIAVHETRAADEVVARVLDAARAVVGGPPMALLVAGEPRVVVTGEGRGGRCLHAAARLAGTLGDLALTALIAGLDGVDGNTGAAGALIDAGTRDRAGSDVDAALRAGDSGPWLEAAGDLWVTGRTGSACCDLWVILVGTPGA